MEAKIGNLIKCRARYVGETNTKFKNNEFSDIFVKQDGWSIKVKLASDTEGKTVTVYNTLEDYMDCWDICAKYNPKRK